jgi:hypothetical protein
VFSGTGADTFIWWITPIYWVIIPTERNTDKLREELILENF